MSYAMLQRGCLTMLPSPHMVLISRPGLLQPCRFIPIWMSQHVTPTTSTLHGAGSVQTLSKPVIVTYVMMSILSATVHHVAELSQPSVWLSACQLITIYDLGVASAND